MKSADDIVRAAQNLQSRYAGRNRRHRNAYHAYRGEYDKLRFGYPESGTDIRERSDQLLQIWNLICPIVDTHRVMLNRLPQIQVPSTVMGEEKADEAAERLEKVHYALWDQSRMTMKHGQNCHNIALYNSGVWFARWNQEKDIPEVTVRSPSETYPLERRNGELAYVIFQWEEEPEVLYESYPEWQSLLGKDAARPGARKLKVIEYIDEENYVVVIQGKSKNIAPGGGQHKLGMIPVSVTPASFVLGDVFPPGAVDQLVSMNDYLNRFQTKWGHALEEVMWPGHALQGEGSDNVVWDPTPGAINRLPEGVQYVQISAPSLPTEVFGHLERIERLMRRVSQFPESASGEMQASVVTGKAVSRLQGVMTGMAAESQYNLSMSLQDISGACLRMMEVYRPKKKYQLRSKEPLGSLAAPGRPGPFNIEVIPERHIGGYYDCLLNYSPFGGDPNTGLTLGMQLVNTDLVSRKWLMNQIPGVGDAVGMEKEINNEKRTTMELEMELQTLAQQQQMQMQSQMQMQQMQMQAQLEQQGPPGAGPQQEQGRPEGGPGVEAAPAGGPPQSDMAAQAAPGQAGLASTTILPAGRPSAMGTGEPFTGDSFPLPFTDVKPYAKSLEAIEGAQALGGAPMTGPGAEEEMPAGPQSEAMPGMEVVTSEEVIGALNEATNKKGEKAIDKLSGLVYLVGEIAQRGWTDGDIEFAITVKGDQQIITNALPQWASEGLLDFRVVTRIPDGAVPVKEA